MNAATIKKLLREPLVHFLLIGAALFLMFNITNDPADDQSNRIVVSPGQVEQLAAVFSRTWLRQPTHDEMIGLVKQHVRDEVYYREALAMGLDQNDPLIRRRLRKKLEFILEDLTLENETSDAVLVEFMQQHPDKFRLGPQVTFQQLYINPNKNRDLDADSQRMLASLSSGVAPESLGDPTLLPYEYNLATEWDIARSFGEAFSRQVIELKPGAWSGPLYSGLGGHLVRVSERREGRLPELAEIRDLVEREYLALRRRELKDLAYQQLLEGYEVIIEPPASGSTAGKAMAATPPEGAAR